MARVSRLPKAQMKVANVRYGELPRLLEEYALKEVETSIDHQQARAEQVCGYFLASMLGCHRSKSISVTDI